MVSPTVVPNAAADALDAAIRHLAARVVVVGPAWHIVYANAAATARWQLTPDEALGRSLWALVPHAADSELFHLALDAVRSGQSRRFLRHDDGAGTVETTLLPTDNGLVWIETDAAVPLVPDGADHRHASEIAAYYETAPVGLCVLDRDLRFVRINRRLAEINGISPEDHLGRTIRDIVPALADAAEPAFRRVLDTGLPMLGIELRGHTAAEPDVERVWIENYYPLFDPEGVVTGINVVVGDVTGEVRAREALRESEARLRFAQELAGLAWWEYDVDSRAITWAPELYAMLGRDPALGPPSLEVFRQMLDPEQTPLLDAQMAEACRSGRPYESLWRIRRPDGTLRWLRGRARPITGADGRVIRLVGTELDITDRVEAEEALADNERLFRALFEQAAVGIAQVAPDGRWLQVNDRLCEITGYARDALLAITFQQITHPDDLERDLELVGRLLRGDRSTYRLEKRYLRPDGSIVWAELSVSLVRDEVTHRPLYFVSVVEDVTARREATEALAQLNRTLEARVDERTRALAERNRELQNFAYIASHDLQEPLRKMQAFSELIRTECSEGLDDGGQYYLSRIQHAAARMSLLLTDLLSFSRIGTRGQPFTRVDLNAIVTEALADLELAIVEAEAEIHVEPLPVVTADKVQMHQFVNNLLLNALKFRRPGIPPVIRISAHIETPPLLSDTHLPPEAVCRLSIEDNGIGFDEKYLDRIFEPFQRLHGRDQYPGTGMGLAICRRIAERHGGTITARSTPGAGSVFTLTLPLNPVEPEAG